MESKYPSLIVLKNKCLRSLFSVLRDKNTSTETFRVYADRVHNILVEEGVCYLPETSKTVITPCGEYSGVEYPNNFCAVSIMRSGDSLLQSFMHHYPSAPVGKVLIQRDENSAEKAAKFYYSKLPKNISDMYVFICDPMLATGGSVCETIRLLEVEGVQEDHIVFLNVVSAPEGIDRVLTVYPQIKIVTCALDDHLNEEKYIVPGLGDYGDRYFNTLCFLVCSMKQVYVLKRIASIVDF